MSRIMKSRPGAAFAACAAIVSLSGCTPVGTAVGIIATGSNAVIQERTTRDGLTDAEIEISVNHYLLEHSAELFADVSTEVVEGRVLLTGAVSSPQDRITAAEIAWRPQGVREVINELQPSQGGGIQGYAEDVAISARVRAKLLADLDIRSINYNIETVEGVVHLIGIAQTGDELRRVASHASAVPGVKRVVSHVLTMDDPRRRRV